MDATTPIELLVSKIQQQEVVIQQLTLLVQQQAEQIQQLTKQIAVLKAELLIYKNKKNSGNSHIPPSKDENRPVKNQSLRGKSDKKPGGQPGHEGTTLEYRAVVDEVIDHRPNYCNCCGKDLTKEAEELIESRQVIDIPIIQSVCTEHRVYRKICSCGHSMESEFPAQLTASLQYGPGMHALTGYLHARQFMPYERMREFFTDVLNIPVSTGGIHNMLHRLTQKAKPMYEQIKERIGEAISVGTDETSMKVNGKKHWFWTWQNDEHTFITHSDNRAFTTIEKHFPEGLPNTILQHDRYAAHFNCEAAGHQICMAHLLRDLQYINELYPHCVWGRDMKTLIHEAIQLKQTLAAADYYKPNIQRINLETRLNQLLGYAIAPANKKAITLQKNLRKHIDSIFSFLHHPKVPPDNNGSERAIRNVKVKQKISGQFKSEVGAQSFAILRSVIDTVIKNARNVMAALNLIANLGG